MDKQTVLTAIIAIMQLISGIITALVLRSQKLADERYKAQQEQLTSHDVKINSLSERLGTCKVDCTQTFATNEMVVREAGFTRRALENVTGSLARMEGKLQLMDRLPEIAGQIASNIAKEFKTPNQ